MTRLLDVLFRLGLYRGVKVKSPADLIQCSLIRDGQFSQVYQTSINDKHALALWLLDECEGPWAMRMHRPLQRRSAFVAFARVTDAVTFRFLSA